MTAQTSFPFAEPVAAVAVRSTAKPIDTAKEYKVVSMRECPLPSQMADCETPERAAEYWRLNVESHPFFNPECECLVVLLLNTRHKVKGHVFVSTGTKDTVLVAPGEVFRAAIVASAASIVVMHNHPSGDSTPSAADIKVTRDLVRAGELVKIEVLDHVIVGQKDSGKGNKGYASLRELGYFYK